MDNTGKIVGPAQLRAARALLNLTQKDVQTATGISPGTLVKMEKEGGHSGHRLFMERIISHYEGLDIVFAKGGVHLNKFEPEMA